MIKCYKQYVSGYETPVNCIVFDDDPFNNSARFIWSSYLDDQTIKNSHGISNPKNINEFGTLEEITLQNVSPSLFNFIIKNNWGNNIFSQLIKLYNNNN